MSSFNFGEIHPVILHFPIVLIFMAFAFDILYWFKERQIFQSIAGWLIMIAAVLLVPTALTGFLAKNFYPPNDPDVLRHQYMAIATALYTIGYAILRGYFLFNHKLPLLYLCLFLGLINIGMVTTTAEFGGIVVRGKGIMFDSLRPKGAPLS